MYEVSKGCDLIRLQQVSRRTGLSGRTIYRKVKEGTFPQPVKISARASAWLRSEVEKWIADCVSTRDAA